jgi:WD40 repeat protein
MSDQSAKCPQCGSTEIHFRQSRGDWVCDACEHKWRSVPAPEGSARSRPAAKTRLFLSYGRGDAAELAGRLEQDLAVFGYEVWRDTRKIRSGKEWEHEIVDGLRSTQLVVALLSPHAVRRKGDAANRDESDSVCLDELSFARFACKTPIVPVMAIPCEPPFVIFRLDYVELLQWREFGEAYQRGFRRLLEAIAAGLQGEVRYRRWEHRFQPFDFADYLFTKRRDFCGREWLFERIEAWRSEPGRQRALLITGDPGIGKSAIVAQLVHANPGGQVLAHHCCQFKSRETLRPGRFVRSLAAQIASQLEGYAAMLDEPKVEAALGEARCQEDPFSAFEEGILGPLHALHAPSGGARYILIDALDEALAHREGPTLVDLLAARLDRLPGWLRVVATSRKDPEVLRRLSGLRAEEIRADDLHHIDDIERFLAHRLGQPGLREPLGRSGLSAEDAIRRLRDWSEGNFLWVEQALVGLESGTYTFDRLDALPPGLTGLYGEFFARHFPDEAAYAPMRKVLEVVVVALEPLTATDLAAAIGLDADYELPDLLDRLAVYLPESDGRYAVYHKSLADWLTSIAVPRPAGRFFASPRRGQERLAGWCWDAYRHGPARMSPYSLRHLPTHLAESARWDDLAALLRDLSYLEAKAEAGLVFDLALDFTRAVERIPQDDPARRRLQLVGQAIRYDIQFIANHPATLFQCLWNRGWWYDSPDAAGYYDLPLGCQPSEALPWTRPRSAQLSTLLESWRAAKEGREPGFTWLRCLRPPELALGGSQIACFRGHKGSVFDVAFDPTGKRIVSAGGGDRTVRIWDAETGAQLACLTGHVCAVVGVAFDPTGKRIVSGSVDCTMRIWDAETGSQLACLIGHEREVVGVAFDPSGTRITSGSSDGTVRMWDAESGIELACLSGHEGPVSGVAFSPDGRRIVSGSVDRTVRIWDAANGSQLACLRGHEDMVNCVAYSPDGYRIASGSYDRTVRIWDAETGSELACLTGHEHKVASVGFDSTGKRVVSGSYDHTVRIWDTRTRVELACLRGHLGEVAGVGFDPTGNRAWFKSLRARVTLFSMDGGVVPAVNDGRTRPSRQSGPTLYTAKCYPGLNQAGNRIVSGSWGVDGTVRVWDAQGGAPIACLRGHEGQIRTVSFDPTGERVVSGSDDVVVRVWDAGTGAPLACLVGHRDLVGSVAFDPTGKRIVSGSRDGTVRVWDAQRGAPLICLTGHRGWVTRVGFDSSGKRIVSGSEDNTLRIWDAETGAQLACLTGHENGVMSLAFDPTGKRIVSGSRDFTVRIWDAQTGAELACLHGHERPVESVAFSLDGRRIVSWSREKERIWDAPPENPWRRSRAPITSSRSRPVIGASPGEPSDEVSRP